MWQFSLVSLTGYGSCRQVITPGFYLHHVEVADQDPASGSLLTGFRETCAQTIAPQSFNKVNL